MTVVQQGVGPDAVPGKAASARPSAAEWVGEVVHSRISGLQFGYQSENDHPGAVAAVARIRRGAGRPAGSVPDLWGLIGAERLYERSWRGEDDAERAETAVYLAVTLWALHQQGHRAADMHVSGGPALGQAVRRLMPATEIVEPVRKRFVRAATASSVDALAGRLRELVLLMRSADVALDYGLLATQLYLWQCPGGRADVHRRWGRSFHAYRKPEPSGPSESGGQPAPDEQPR
ncbi:type I-E CRISPR-associated protein Cse2/CasB [Streptomyces sp. NBC_01754]|uniref:type I-E CRISPR-associated protein Cse2/CasB n=1 Tax=Streptomyces sp. NBC_01754 TaxID=2975930 RepID=UPI002DDC5A41|nr:type I-E CRISPR-associated protein Cse2/CasB [Streptomyces sp. NBC_01754]WSC93455.1 type I-E CRISPR-associated protein Cse2/CasB [Streptomyces sp. NBC_01754]